jgi:hypothetical protein
VRMLVRTNRLPFYLRFLGVALVCYTWL